MTTAFASAALAQTTADPRFRVERYQVEGSPPLSARELARMLAPFTGEGVGVEQLQAAAKALETALSDRGYTFYRVVLPPQSAEGVITLRALPFQLGTIDVSGNQHFSRENVLASLPSLRAGESPNVREVGRDRALANDHPAKAVEVAFKQGAKTDTIDADVKVHDNAPGQFFLTVDNTGTPDNGPARIGAGFQYSNLFDRDHAITATYTTSPEQPSDLRQYGVFYRAPIYGWHGALSAYYSHSDTDSGTVANFFQVSGRGDFFGLRCTQRLPPIGAYGQLVEIGVEDRFFENDVSFSGTPIGVDVRSRPLLLRHEGRFDGTDFAVRHALELAANLSGGSSNGDAAYSGNRAGATSDWRAWRYVVEGSKAFGGWLATARIKGQLSSDALLTGEQLGLGGAASVRGLEEREGTGDRGYVGTLELLTPQVVEGLRAVAFTDAGHVRLNEPTGGLEAKQGASSAGFGLRFFWRRYLSLVADWAHVFNGTATTQDGDDRWHLSLVLRY